MPQPVAKLYVKTPYMGYIAALAMMGPIVTPMQITQTQAVTMLKSGLKLFQYDPNTKMTRALTLANISQPMSVATPAAAPAKAAYIAAAPEEAKQITGAPVPPAPAKEEVPQVAPEVVETATEPEAEDKSVASQFNANELIDESKVDWKSMSKAERREMRAKIDAQKAAIAAQEEAAAESSEEKSDAES